MAIINPTVIHTQPNVGILILFGIAYAALVIYGIKNVFFDDYEP